MCGRYNILQNNFPLFPTEPSSLCQRVEGITVLVKELPEANRKMLYILMEHLNK